MIKNNEELTTNIVDDRFSRFDQELIDKYFNEKGKKAIDQYVSNKVTEELEYVVADGSLDDTSAGFYIESRIATLSAQQLNKGE